MYMPRNTYVNKNKIFFFVILRSINRPPLRNWALEKSGHSGSVPRVPVVDSLYCTHIFTEIFKERWIIIVIHIKYEKCLCGKKFFAKLPESNRSLEVFSFFGNIIWQKTKEFTAKLINFFKRFDKFYIWFLTVLFFHWIFTISKYSQLSCWFNNCTLLELIFNFFWFNKIFDWIKLQASHVS